MMPRPVASSVAFPKILTPAGGMVLSIVVSGGLWSGLVVAMHAAGLF